MNEENKEFDIRTPVMAFRIFNPEVPMSPFMKSIRAMSPTTPLFEFGKIKVSVASNFKVQKGLRFFDKYSQNCPRNILNNKQSSESVQLQPIVSPLKQEAQKQGQMSLMQQAVLKVSSNNNLQQQAQQIIQNFS